MRPFEITVKMYAVGEIAKLLEVSDTAVRKWLTNGSVRAVRLLFYIAFGQLIDNI